MIPNVISISQNAMGGTPVFIGTRVPVQLFFDHLELGISVDEFLNDFPAVTRDQVLATLKIAERLLTAPNLNSIYEAVA